MSDPSSEDVGNSSPISAIGHKLKLSILVAVPDHQFSEVQSLEDLYQIKFQYLKLFTKINTCVNTDTVFFIVMNKILIF